MTAMTIALIVLAVFAGYVVLSLLAARELCKPTERERLYPKIYKRDHGA